MAMRQKKSDRPKAPVLPSGERARHLIEEQTAAFLKNGGSVSQVANGVSGYNPAERQRPMSVEKGSVEKKPK